MRQKSYRSTAGLKTQPHNYRYATEQYEMFQVISPRSERISNNFSVFLGLTARERSDTMRMDVFPQFPYDTHFTAISVANGKGIYKLKNQIRQLIICKP